jgi:two-component system, OmpR family, sensor kinase
MSLRARLALTLVLVTCVVLAVAGGAVAWFVKAYLNERLDSQLAQLRAPARTFAPEFGSLQPGNPNRPVQVFDLSGAYVQLRDLDGDVLRSDFLTDNSSFAAPDLPASLPNHATFEVGSQGPGKHVGYRVRVEQLPRGGPTVLIALPTAERDSTMRRLVAVELFASMVVVGLVLTAAWWIAGAQLRPLEEMEEVAAEIASGDLTVRVPERRSPTEVGRLGRSLNGMLEQIEGAFAARSASETTLRRFVADASHELRTPLTSIQGYAELIDRVGDDDPAVVTPSVDRIRAESRRMSRLVDDLLQLARLDEDPALQLGSLDLTALANDVAADVRAVDGNRPCAVEANGPCVVRGDRARLTQVLVNLVANARVHTPPLTPIEIRVHADDRWITLEVVDHGPGLPPGAESHVFDRFWRADAARGRANGGAGLGLSIVAAIVAAHEGQVSARSTPGGGATLTVRLPIAGPTKIGTAADSANVESVLLPDAASFEGAGGVERLPLPAPLGRSAPSPGTVPG